MGCKLNHSRQKTTKKPLFSGAGPLKLGRSSFNVMGPVRATATRTINRDRYRDHHDFFEDLRTRCRRRSAGRIFLDRAEQCSC
jgi:hypothetical protein